MARKGASRAAESIQESPFKKGKELELSLLGPSFTSNYEPERTHTVARREVNEENLEFDDAIHIVKKDLDDKEWVGAQADEDEEAFKFVEMSTNPSNPYAAILFTELCRQLDFDDINSKKIKFYNAIDSVLDRRFGTDFFFEIDPSLLVEKFGDSIKKPRQSIYVTVDLTLDPEKVSHKADLISLFDEIPERKEQETRAKKDAERILGIIMDKCGIIEEPPESGEVKKPDVKSDIEKVKRGVVRRIKRKKIA